ncbi:MAG: GWxTD domain-containing protein [Candidatus Aminicenantes bacterium]|nr:GWxTD domain-containing protein [Candidatus Aminicenantes bacterium]
MMISLFAHNNRRKDNLSLHVLLTVMFYILIALVYSSCRYHTLKKKLLPEDADFLSQVRYIITKEEENLFLETPDSEKDKLKQEFWKRRDPDPYTEENEFKIEYFNRIEKANELFRNEGTPGWLTDRGRIFILFGPPTYRDMNPLGYDYYGRCKEVWQYGNFPVVFVDDNCIGNYRLLTYDLSSIRSLNLAYMHELSFAQEQAQQSIMEQERFFDFDWTVEKTRDEPDRIEGVVSIDVPYTKIWLTQREEKLTTSLEVHLELRDSKGKIWWEFEDSFEVELDEENLPSRKNTAFEIEIPFVLDAEVGMLRQTQSWMHLRVRNRTGGDEREKVKEFKHP